MNEPTTTNGGATPVSSGPSTNEMILFWASFFTLIAAGIGFSIRNAILVDWSKSFGFTQFDLGTITGGGLVGFGITIIIFSFVADRVGYGWLMVIAFLFHVSSAVVTLAATPLYNAYGKDACYWALYIGAFLFALGNGTCEAVINPLTATLFPRNKTHWLNILHAGWPGGLVLGALLGLVFEFTKVPWEYQMVAFLLPTILYGAMMVGRRFPHSEAKVSGVTIWQMLKELGLLGASVVVLLLGLWFTDLLGAAKLPTWPGWVAALGLLIVFGFASEFQIGHWMLAVLYIMHAGVGYVELGTDSWITTITGALLDNRYLGLTLLIWTSALMFGLRFFAGPIVHKISPLGLLLVSALLGCAGLLLLGKVEGFLFLFLAATVYGIGKTFYWPTMLGVVSERFPRGGALTLGCIGGVGMLSAGLLGAPGIGYTNDYFTHAKLTDPKDNPAPDSLERYVARTDKGEPDEKSFLFFPKVAGLDGKKVATLLGKPGEKNGDGKLLDADVKVLLAAAKHPVSEEQSLPVWWSDEKNEKLMRDLLGEKANEKVKALFDWWYGTPDVKGAVKFVDVDKVPIGDAVLYGGRMALIWTAVVPAGLAIGYLLLMLYFKAVGGYKAEVLVGHAAKDEEFTGGTEGPGEG